MNLKINKKSYKKIIKLHLAIYREKYFFDRKSENLNKKFHLESIMHVPLAFLAYLTSNGVLL